MRKPVVSSSRFISDKPNTKPFLALFNPFLRNETKELQIKKMQHEHRQKSQTYNRERLLVSFQALKNHHPEDRVFKRLQRLIKTSQQKHPFSSEDVNLFQCLEELALRSRKEKKEGPFQSKTKQKWMPEEANTEMNEIFNRLEQLIRKK